MEKDTIQEIIYTGGVNGYDDLQINNLENVHHEDGYKAKKAYDAKLGLQLGGFELGMGGLALFCPTLGLIMLGSVAVGGLYEYTRDTYFCPGTPLAGNYYDYSIQYNSNTIYYDSSRNATIISGTTAYFSGHIGAGTTESNALNRTTYDPVYNYSYGAVGNWIQD